MENQESEMDITTINQIIETGGLLILGFGAMVFYWKGIKKKDNIQREISLLKDCVFYREIIEKYRNVKGKNNFYNKYREEVRQSIDYSPSRYSEIAEIRLRLESLKKQDSAIESFLQKLKIQ
jgi:hypothetical protein